MNARPPGPFSPPLRRLAVTLAAPVLVALAGRVRLPGLGPVPDVPDGLGVLSLGLGPFVSSFVVVEIAALAVPRWRPLRVGGGAGRAPLEVAAVSLGLGLALVQGFGVSRHLQSLGALSGGSPATLVPTLTLAAGSGALVWVASLVGRHGLGNGFAVLLTASAIAFPFGPLLNLPADFSNAPGVFVPIALALFLGVYGIIALAVIRMLLANDRAAAAGFGRVRLRDPASGLVPLPWVATLLLLPATFSGWWPTLQELRFHPGTFLHDGLFLVLSISLAIPLARLFHRPRQVAAVWGRLEGADPAVLEGQAAAALHVARLRSVALLATLVLLPALAAATDQAAFLPAAGLGLAFALAAVADVLGEWRARRGLGDLVSLWPEHRLYAVDAALEALRRAGIPAFARGVHYRTLGQFFAPYVPVEILVPSPRAAEADAILRGVLAPDAPARAREGAAPPATR